MNRRTILLALASITLAAACGSDKEKGRAAPEPPWTGAPVAVIVDKVTPPETVDVSVYNFSDRKIGTYMLLFRYYDKDGNVLRVKTGTPFEDDHDFMSVSGRDFLAAPKSWTSFEVDMLHVPANTVRAEALVGRVYPVAPDGFHIEDEPLWDLEGGWTEWPEKK